MTTAHTIRRAKFTVVNPTAEPSDAWIRAVAVMLLASADRRLAERKADQAADQTAGQAGDDQHGGPAR